jgi:hypothetical protein
MILKSSDDQYIIEMVGTNSGKKYYNNLLQIK